MSYAAAIEALSKPPPAQIPVKVVIPEGMTRAQIAQLASADGLTGSYLASSVRSPLLDPSHYGAPHGTSNLEGFLFPATYDMLAGAPASRLVNEQLTAFEENFGAQRGRTRTRPTHNAVPTVDRCLDDRARGAGSWRSGEDRRSHLQPAASGYAAGHRCNHLLRGRAAKENPHLHRRTDRKRSAHRLPLQHAHPLRPATDTDLQPRSGFDRSGRAPRARPLPVLRRRRRRLRRAGVLPRRGRSSKQTSPPIARRSPRTTANRRSARASRCHGWVCSAGRSITAARRRCSTLRSPNWD